MNLFTSMHNTSDSAAVYHKWQWCNSWSLVGYVYFHTQCYNVTIFDSVSRRLLISLAELRTITVRCVRNDPTSWETKKQNKNKKNSQLFSVCSGIINFFSYLCFSFLFIYYFSFLFYVFVVSSRTVCRLQFIRTHALTHARTHARTHAHTLSLIHISEPTRPP